MYTTEINQFPEMIVRKVIFFNFLDYPAIDLRYYKIEILIEDQMYHIHILQPHKERRSWIPRMPSPASPLVSRAATIYVSLIHLTTTTM